MDHLTVTDTETGIVLYDSTWPAINVNSIDEMFMVSADQHAYDGGHISAAAFTEMWGIHPDADYTVVVETKE